MVTLELLMAAESRDVAAPFGLYIVLMVVALPVSALLVVNARRQKRGERFPDRFGVALAIMFFAAGAMMLMAAINLAILWGIALSGMSLAGTWIYLMAALARGVPRGAERSNTDYGAPSGGPLKTGDSSWLAISSQIAGILSFVVAVIALLTD
jgi:hypothetical protein